MILAWRPFLDPLSLHDQWYLLLVPLAFGISVVYKAVRLRDVSTFWRPVVWMTSQIVVAMILLAIASYLLFQLAAPLVVPMKW